MTLSGTWKMSIEAEDIDPEIMPRQATLRLNELDSAVTGKLDGDYPMGTDVAVVNFARNENAISWQSTMRGEHLRAQRLEFVGTVSGDAMSGKVEVGIFGTATWTAERS
jgi:hypothetical protein